MTKSKDHLDQVLAQVQGNMPSTTQKRKTTKAAKSKQVTAMIDSELVDELNDFLTFASQTPLAISKTLFFQESIKRYLEVGKEELVKQKFLKKGEEIPHVEHPMNIRIWRQEKAPF